MFGRRKSKTKEKEAAPSPRGDDSAILELYDTLAGEVFWIHVITTCLPLYVDPDEPECINLGELPW